LRSCTISVLNLAISIDVQKDLFASLTDILTSPSAVAQVLDRPSPHNLHHT